MFWLEKILAPEFCWWCYEARQDYLCPHHLTPLGFFICPVCHQRSYETEIKTITCSSCRSKTFLDGLFPLFKFDEPFQKFIYGYKYDLYFKFSQTLAKILKNNLPHFFNNFVFVPIPSHFRKIKERGFDHIELILKESGLKFKSYLQKIKSTPPQAKLTSFKERQENIANCFTLKTKPQEKILILFDDIKTTGLTLNEAAKVLKEGGVKKVLAVTLACQI